MEPSKDINQLYGVPLGIYQERFTASDPQEVICRTGVPFDEANSRFVITVLGFQVYAAWPDYALSPADAAACPHDLYGTKAQILLLRYLLEGVRAEAAGMWLPYRELPWGDVYERQFTGRCITRLAFSFGTKPEQFARACEALGGVAFEKGDASYDLQFIPGVVVRLILWTGSDGSDDDVAFPPSSQWLFSDNTPLAFTAEDVAVIGDTVIGALKEVSKKL